MEMGARLLIKNETTSAHVGYIGMSGNRTIMNLENWRALREGKHNGADGLFIITINFRTYFIPEFTMTMLHEANYCNKKLDIPYEYIKNVLSCDKCFGKGNTDWITAARGARPQPFHHGEGKFIRNKKGPVLVVSLHPDFKKHHVSTAYTAKGETLCKRCCGTGLYLVKQDLVRETVKLEYS